jgi:hypothetical protein
MLNGGKWLRTDESINRLETASIEMWVLEICGSDSGIYQNCGLPGRVM